MLDSTRIYLDHAATTPVHPEVVDAMLPYWTGVWGNPSSIHQHGQAAKYGLEEARRSIAEQLGARPKEIIFTGCGSESDNMALRGLLLSAEKPHLITSIVEHKAILDTAYQLRDHYNVELTVVGVDQYGQVDPDEVAAAIRPNTTLISIMTAQNEVGTIQPLDAIGRIAHENGILFHTDAVQAMSTTAWNLAEMPIDMLSIAPHKFNGPKGIGVLYVRDGITLRPTLTGGGQEEGRRAGTSNVAFAAGAAKALELSQTTRDTRIAHYMTLRDALITRVLDTFGDDVKLTGHPTKRLPQHTSFTFRDLSGNDLLMHLDTGGVSASSGSACSVGNPKPSRILQALGFSAEWQLGGLRLSVGHSSTMDEVNRAVGILEKVVGRLQRLKMYA